ncbi:MAG: MBL fold metallo-hydrolase [Bacteroidales bacterium]|nr:MBL fold metallo-hydrolase [Bacteroidales bacterium]
MTFFRNLFLRSVILFCLSTGLFIGPVLSQEADFMPAWQTGFLDIHFIATGTGNCSLIIMPDGTTLLIDAGEQDPTSPRVLSPRNTGRYPNYGKLGYQWMAAYIRDMLAVDSIRLDYALITHYHEDHFGCVYPGIAKSTRGDYYLSGITGLGDEIPIGILIDRGTAYPFDLKEKASDLPRQYASLLNYWRFIDWQVKNSGMEHQEIRVGANDQVVMLNKPDAFPDFSITMVNANGVIWGGTGKPNFTLMPTPKDIINNGAVPDENTLSCGILLRFGGFAFYTSGDIHGPQPEYMAKPHWYDIESLVAPIIGEVDVTTANHHGNRDAMSAYYLSELKPRVIIQEVWSSDHPGHETLLRMTSQHIWRGERDLFATAMLNANKLVIGELIDKSYKSMQGHIVVRVKPGGDEYFVYILNNQSIEKNVLACYGPYKAKQ